MKVFNKWKVQRGAKAISRHLPQADCCLASLWATATMATLEDNPTANFYCWPLYGME